MAELRSTTNLVIPDDLRLPREEARSNFMYVYTSAYTGLEPVFMNKLWLSVLFPEISSDPRYGKDRKAIRAYATWMEKRGRAGMLKLKKVNDPADPHFVVAVPLAEFNNRFIGESVGQFQRWFLGKEDLETGGAVKDLQDAIAQESEANGGVHVRQVVGSQIVPRLGLDSRGTIALNNCFFGLRLQTNGALSVVFADFKISKAEAQQLTTTEWLKIRNIDLYPLLLQWQVSLWGYRGDAPTSSFPMSKVSKTLPPVHESQARINEFGISIAPDGSPVWLPEKLDNTQRYEDLYAQVGDKGDDTFGLIDVVSASKALSTGGEIKVNLPANIPVLIDWVNNRYAYTQSNGALKVQDLSRFKVCDAAHARMILTHQIMADKEIHGWALMAGTAGVKNALFFTEEEITMISNVDPVVARALIHQGGIEIEEYWPKAKAFYLGYSGNASPTLADISTEGDPIWRPLARFIEQAQAAIIANMDAVNHVYSVHGVSARMGYMTLMAKYGNNRAAMVAQANMLCSAATAARMKSPQELQAPLPSVPLIMEKFGVMPHQAKVRNLLKDSPDFAILPVQAGGGKTPLAILDILQEIKANRSQPYLVLCPPSLVAQYVKEVTFFTSGKLNVIPIESNVIEINGLERLTAMTASAPRNSVVVCNYDVLRNKAYDVCYGTTSVKIYPIIEFLRQFNFGYVMCDEAHFLKNDSGRSRAAQMLIADIPKKRLASGTMAHDSPSDLALQIALLDPTIFGSRDDFNTRFAAKGAVKGGRVTKWKPGAQQQIMNLIQSRVVVAKAMRKEWAALLPKAVELMHPCEMTEAQKTVYDAILNPIIEQMREDAKTNPTLRKFFEGSATKTTDDAGKGNKNLDEDEDEEAEDAADEDAGEGLAALLGFYLARLEQFMTAPGKDELGKKMLSGDDLISDKTRTIRDIVKAHIEQDIPGKCLIFTNFVESAEEIFEVLSQDPVLARSGILYTAANQVEDGASFEGDDRKRWMVGVENSMNTGLNFQYVSRLIRVENVWNPGTLEQGNSRINRPQMKEEERRKEIYYDWIITNRSIDVTKTARLISKIIAVAKFENTENPEYEALEDLEIVAMNADSILTANDWDTNLVQYMDGYKAYNSVKVRDYEAYRAEHGNIALAPLMEAPVPTDAMIMAEVPYTAGLELYKAGEAGLVRVDAFLRHSQVFGDDQENYKTENGHTARNLVEKEALMGKEVHTEFGDGVISSVNSHQRKISVALASGYVVQVKMASSFIITDKAMREVSMREQVAKAIHDKMPLTAPVDVVPGGAKMGAGSLRRAEREKQRQEELRKQQQQIEVETKFNVELEFTLSNGFLGLSYFPEKDDDASAVLQAMGFRPVEPHVFAEIPTYQHLVKLSDKWLAAGFTFDRGMNKLGIGRAISDFGKLLKRGKQDRRGAGYRFATRNDLQNFFRMEFKPSTSDTEFKPYPLVEDGRAYLVMPLRGQPATLKAMQVKVPGIRWQRAPEALTYYGLDTKHIAAKLKEMLAAGIGISNIEDLKAEGSRLRKEQIRNAAPAK